MIPGSANPLLLASAAAEPTDYEIEHSVRFNSADSAYLSRTPASASNRKTWTISLWLKRCKLGTIQSFTSSNNDTILLFLSDDSLAFWQGGLVRVTTQVFRDCSAWYHILLAVDTTNATAQNRARIYVNGTEITTWTTNTTITQNLDTNWNAALAHQINSNSNSQYGDLYIADVYSIDGQALDPTSFGEFDDNGVWQPKAYTGSYGTNGFHLDFADTSSATALGYDVSGNNNDWTPHNLVAGPPYTDNGFSTVFDGNGDYLTTPSNTNVGFGTGDFTIEAWIYSNGTQSTYATIISLNDGSGGNDWQFEASNNKISIRDLFTPTTTYTHNVWHHVAWTRQGSSNYLFLDGVQLGTFTDSTDWDYGSFNIGANRALSYFFNGKISNVRVIKDRALYTAAFTPPTTALTATYDTVLLTCQNATVRDNSNIGLDVAASGDVAIVNQGPFNGYSGEFDGSADYLDVTSSADFNFGTGEFTVECWYYSPTASAGSNQEIFHTNVSAATNQLSLRTKNNLFILFFNSGQPTINSGAYVNNNQWHHLAATRDSGGTARVFVDGVQRNSADWSTVDITNAGSAGAPRIGNGVDGKISNLRAIKGQALYTSNFTPPTEDLTTTSQGATASNVKLLTCQNSTFIDNSPSAHTITAANDASTISVNPHTDKYSVTFDGTGDYLNIANASGVAVGTGDFTVEYWVNLAATRTPSVWWASGASSVLISDTGAAEAVIGSSTDTGSGYSKLIDASSSLAANTWGHVAVVRSSGTTTIYLNGKAGGSTTSITGSFDCAYIGTQKTYSPRELTGKISNLRVTNGQALYTGNFLPSTEDLTTTSQGAIASNVKLLTCQSYKIQDNSPSAHTITVNGDAAPSTVAPFVTSGAGSFDGTGDYLTVASSSDFALGTGDFTIEFWAKPTAAWGSGDTVLASGTVNQIDTWLMMVATNKLLFRSNGQNDIEQASASLSGWNHIAAVRSSSTVNLYLNGTSVGSGTYANSISANAITIGSQPNGVGEYTGYLSNVRISKGLARYTSNFTPPTEDFDPTDPDTTLLILQGNTLEDLTGDHPVTAYGNAVTTTESPFEPVAGSDAMLDSPTNYGSGDLVRGNYCTLNPLDKATNGGSTNGNFEYLSSGGSPNAINGTMAVSSGKWYYESIATNNAYGSGNPVYQAGFVSLDIWDGVFANPMVRTAGSGFYGYSYREGYKSVNGTFRSFATSAAIGDAIGLALDLDAGELEIYKNGTSLGVLATGLSGTFIPCVESDSSSTGQAATVNFGQHPFDYPAPAGYKSLCSTNLPTPTIADGSTAMDVALYTGTSSGAVVSTPNMSPDLVWIKDRGNTFNHQLFDTIRGVNSALLPNLTSAENNYNSFTSFNPTGFTVPNVNGTGANGNNHVAWTWDAGSSTVSNTDGTITSQVRANPSAGFSVVTYTGTDANATVGHGLGITPELLLVKNRTTSFDWAVYHSALGGTKYLKLNTTDQAVTASGRWSNTDPTTTVFSVGNSTATGNSDNYVAYCFAPVEGYSAFGSYTGNGSVDGPFVFTNFHPRWVLIKRTDTTSNWTIIDTERQGYNVDNDPLYANLSDIEGTTDLADILSNGFKLRSANVGVNASAGTYIYASFAEQPFSLARAR